MKKDGKQEIINAFKELLTKKTIDKVTVKAICEHCGVNRQTFYNHFADIMDVFKFIFYKELSAEIAQNRTFETWQNGFLATMSYLKRNEKMILHVYYSSYWPEAYRYITDLSRRLMDHVVEECETKLDLKLDEQDHSFIVSFYAYLFDGFIVDWVGGGMKTDPEIILKQLLVMISGSIPRSVSAFVSGSTSSNV